MTRNTNAWAEAFFCKYTPEILKPNEYKVQHNVVYVVVNVMLV